MTDDEVNAMLEYCEPFKGTTTKEGSLSAKGRKIQGLLYKLPCHEAKEEIDRLIEDVREPKNRWINDANGLIQRLQSLYIRLAKQRAEARQRKRLCEDSYIALVGFEHGDVVTWESNGEVRYGWVCKWWPGERNKRAECVMTPLFVKFPEECDIEDHHIWRGQAHRDPHELSIYERVDATEAVETFEAWRRMEAKGELRSQSKGLDSMLGEDFLAKQQQPGPAPEPNPEPQRSTMKENWDPNELYDPTDDIPY